MMQIKRTITQKQIDKNMNKYLEKVQKDIEEKRVDLKAPTTAFLLQIKPQVQLSIDHGVSYKNIAKSIEESFGFRMTENSIKNFANTFLTVTKKRYGQSMRGAASQEKKREKRDHLPKSSKAEKLNKLTGNDTGSSDGDEF